MTYSLTLRDMRTYMLALLFIAGNLLLPRAVHFIPGGGPMLLPIYFFTLVGAYKYGWRVGLITALLSPAVNAMLFGMPATAMLPIVTMKSVILAITAGIVASRSKEVSLLSLLLVVVTYQALGTLGEWAMTGNAEVALSHLRIAIPGMLIQIIGGWAVIKYLLAKSLFPNIC